jgi:hypothetical protein
VFEQPTEYIHQHVHAHQDLPVLKVKPNVYHADLIVKNVKEKITVPNVKKIELNHQFVDAKMVLSMMDINVFHVPINASLVMKTDVSNALMEDTDHQIVSAHLEHLIMVLMLNVNHVHHSAKNVQDLPITAQSALETESTHQNAHVQNTP